MTTHEGFRHLYTVAPAPSEDGGGSPAFRTVALSAPLEAVRAELEEIVGAYTSPADRRISRQAVRMYDENYAALTTTTPLDGGPDGRRGNYLAETFVVPSAWLREADDDLAAAFAALPWSDARAVDLHADGLRSLGAGQALPRLVPGPLSRLVLLRERVPETMLAPLLAAVARAALGHRPLAVAEGPAGGVDRLIPLLPLVLPSEARRALQLRTWSPPGESPAVDLVGVPADARSAAERTGGDVIDLSTAAAPETDDDPAGRFGRWAAEAVATGDWQALATAHERAGDGSLGAFLEGFEALRGAGRDIGSSASLLEARRADWLSREALDRLFVERSQALAAEHRESTRRLEQQVDSAFDDLQRQLDERIRARTEELRQMAAQRTSDLDNDAEAAREALRKAADTRRKELETAARDLGKNLESGRSTDRGAKIPWQTSGAQAGQRPTGGFPRPALYAVTGAVVVALALGLWWWLARDTEVPGTSGTDTEAVPADDAVNLSPVLARLADGATAGRLLAAANAQDTQPATRDFASRLYLNLLLGEVGGFSEPVRDALTQSIVGATVDGDPGAGTLRAVSTYLAGSATCCSDLSAQARRSCILLDAVALPEPACAGTDPFDGAVAWDPEPTAELLALIRSARGKASAGVAPALGALDLATVPDPAVALARAMIDDDEARRLLALARALATGTAPSALPREIDASELDAVQALPAFAGGAP
jgi:hypothetical protein